MKKTIAKMMAAAMVFAAMPAMAMPTFDVNAESVSNSTIAVNTNDSSFSNLPATIQKNYGSMQYNNVVQVADGVYMYVDSAGKVQIDGNNNTMPSLDLKANELTGNNSWKTGIVYYNNNGDVVALKNASTVMKNTTLVKDTDYIDNTGAVDKIVTDANGEAVITFNSTKFTEYTNSLLKGGEAKTIDFYVAMVYEDASNNNTKTGLIVELGKAQVGETFSNAKTTKHTGAFTADGFITDATVTVDSAGHATLVSVSDTDKKVNMLKQDLDVSEIMIKGVSLPVWKLDDQVLKKAKMKTITAKNIKHLNQGCLRNCKKLRKARLGGSKMRKIHANAFYDCENLKNIKIDVKRLKAVGSKAFKKLKKNCTITLKGPQAKYKKAVKMIKKSGTDQVKFKKG